MERMETVRNGLRSEDLEKDTYDRLVCLSCEAELERAEDTDAIGTVRACPDCGTAWKEL